jgi:putative membrane protein
MTHAEWIQRLEPEPRKEDQMMMFWDGGHVASWQIALMWVGMIAFWGVVVWFGYIFLRAATNGTPTPDEGQSARRILDGRLARGEVDADQYQLIRSALVEAPDNKVAVGSPR